MLVSKISKVSISISWAPDSFSDLIWPVRLSMMGTSTLAETGETILLLTLSKRPIPTTRALAEPCLPGLDLSYETILQGSPSIRR